MTFRGRYESSVDPKGRINVPAKLREGFAPGKKNDVETVVLTSGLEPCLVGYTPSAWADLEAKIAKLPDFKASVVKLKRILISGAVECPIDPQGRILVPPILRRYAGVERDVVWVGQQRYIEIWSTTRWEQWFLAATQDLDAIRNDLADLIG